ncbi:bifunctional diaminohydroxyphosphoribosylaminopyrimidine deaminase/5-amino-6-(5-phosphoribosylamino)uracil reductase RibD [Chitinophaga lutea]
MDSSQHEIFMRRCLQLAALGAGHAAPNPMVGAVLVHEGRIIGEGYHRTYGQAHAEVNCINSVPPELEPLISRATMYVSLEPCAHHGKTPPCADLLISRKVAGVVIGCVDTFSKVAGKGIARLEAAGIPVVTGVLEKECRALNARFFTFHEQQRPYVVLKWAQSADGYIAPEGGAPVRISNVYSDRLVHRWRARESAIMVGTRTAVGDDPSLTVRHWPGKNPLRIVIDREGKVPLTHRLHDDSAPTLWITARKGGPRSITLDFEADILPPLMQALHAEGVQSILVEGGAHLLERFIESGLWDEMRIITGSAVLGGGLRAPSPRGAQLTTTAELAGDHIAWYVRQSSSS